MGYNIAGIKKDGKAFKNILDSAALLPLGNRGRNAESQITCMLMVYAFTGNSISF